MPYHDLQVLLIGMAIGYIIAGIELGIILYKNGKIE